MRVLGVDPGLTRCGLGVIDAEGRRASLVHVSVATSAPDEAVEHRIARVADALDEVIDTHAPEAIALERVFAQHNVRTVMGTAQASGVVMLAAARRGLPIALYTPSEVKAAVTGSGRAPKDQVGFMVARILRLAEPPKPADAADSLAIALAHAWRAGSPAHATAAQSRWAAAERAARRRG